MSSSCEAKQYHLALSFVSFHAKLNSVTWHWWLKLNKSNTVKQSRVPFHTCCDNNQLKSSPLCSPLTWEAHCFSCFHLSDQIKRLLPDDNRVDLDMHMAVLLVRPWQDRSIALRKRGQRRCRQQLCSPNYDQAKTEGAPAFCLQADRTEACCVQWHPANRPQHALTFKSTYRKRRVCKLTQPTEEKWIML